MVVRSAVMLAVMLVELMVALKDMKMVAKMVLY